MWLDPALTSPYAFFQHWMPTDDAELRRMLAQFTLLPMDEIDALVAAHAEAPATAGRPAGAGRGRHDARPRARGGARPPSRRPPCSSAAIPREASADALAAVAAEVPSARLEPGESLSEGVDLVAVLLRTGLATSQGDARRQLDQRGISVNGDKVDPDRRLVADDLLHGRWVLLRKGKRDWAALDAGPS